VNFQRTKSGNAPFRILDVRKTIGKNVKFVKACVALFAMFKWKQKFDVKWIMVHGGRGKWGKG